MLGTALDVPILMLPDFLFPSPLETEEELEVLVCGSAPQDHEHGSVFDAMRRTIERMLISTGRRIRIHVFTDRPIADALTNAWTSLNVLGTTVLIHDPETAAPFLTDDESSRVPGPSSTLRSPWLRWMQRRMAGRALDVAHFVCHGYLSRGRGALLFAQSPIGRTDRFLTGPVTAAELQTFLTSTGAWATSFSSVSDNFSEPGLRAVADGIAQSRPGPMLMASMKADPQCNALAAGYRFLFAPARSPVPKSSALLIYCQPYLVAPPTSSGRDVNIRASGLPAETVEVVARNDAQIAAASLATNESPLGPLYAGRPRVSSWVASTARFAEGVHLKYQQLSRDQIASVEQCNHDSKIALETVGRLTRFVAERANKGTPE